MAPVLIAFMVLLWDSSLTSITGPTRGLFADAPQIDKSQIDKSEAKPAAPDPDDAPKDGQPTAQTTNALAKETSPYLLMHAHNPVQWYGWNQESLALAKKLNRPIFLSVGYSSCHWCHVMERESFTDKEIAAFMNKHFVCIKVDREERPDVDEIYMQALLVYQSMSGQPQNGGWPLNLFLTPEGQPFYGSVYVPPRDGDRGTRIGFLTILETIHQNWVDNQDGLRRDARVVTENTQRSLSGRPGGDDASEPPALSKDWADACMEGLQDGFDPKFGGFRFSAQNPEIPKFPEPSKLLFLIDQLRAPADQADTEGDVSGDELLQMLTTTCDHMMMGGLHDHLGGGFHRYSVDRYWAIPHFEKMLYDNGQLASVYAAAFKLTGNPDYRRVCQSLLQFVDREMTDEGGAFYASIDAESDGAEGKYYRWDAEEVQAILGKDANRLFAEVYGLDGLPNFEDKYHVLARIASWNQLSEKLGLPTDELLQRIDGSRSRLLPAREQRPRPLTDKKILTSWNGLMIGGYADAGRIFEHLPHVAKAERAARFVLEKMMTPDGRLYRTSTGGHVKLNAYLDDYAFLIQGLLAIHQANHQPEWLEHAVRLQRKQDELFWDEKDGGYFFTSNDHETLLARAKRPSDGPMPSGNSVSACNLLYLANATEDASFRQRARQTVLAASAILDALPTSAPRMLIAAEALLKLPQE